MEPGERHIETAIDRQTAAMLTLATAMEVQRTVDEDLAEDNVARWMSRWEKKVVR